MWYFAITKYIKTVVTKITKGPHKDKQKKRETSRQTCILTYSGDADAQLRGVKIDSDGHR